MPLGKNIDKNMNMYLNFHNTLIYNILKILPLEEIGVNKIFSIYKVLKISKI